MKNLAGLLTFLTLMAAAAWYCPLIARRRVKPAPATYTIGFLAMNLAVAAYHSIPGRTLVENITLYAAALEITLVLAVMWAVLHRSGEFKVAFDRLQLICLGVMAAIFVYWLMNRDQADVTFYTTQALLLVAYVATILKALRLKIAFDSIGNWGLIFTGCMIGGIPAIILQSPYGEMNTVRGVVSSGITTLILLRYDRKSGYARWKDELATLADFYGIRHTGQ